MFMHVEAARRVVVDVERAGDRREIRDVEEVAGGERGVVHRREEVAVVVRERVVVREVDEAAEAGRPVERQSRTRRLCSR